MKQVSLLLIGVSIGIASLASTPALPVPQADVEMARFDYFDLPPIPSPSPHFPGIPRPIVPE